MARDTLYTTLAIKTGTGFGSTHLTRYVVEPTSTTPHGRTSEGRVKTPAMKILRHLCRQYEQEYLGKTYRKVVTDVTTDALTAYTNIRHGQIASLRLPTNKGHAGKIESMPPKRDHRMAARS